jgi:hypothetical protein
LNGGGTLQEEFAEINECEARNGFFTSSLSDLAQDQKQIVATAFL